MQRAADRIVVAPEPLRGRLADDDRRGRAATSSASVKSRPRTSGMSIAWKKPGLTIAPVDRDRGVGRQHRLAGRRERRLRVVAVAERERRSTPRRRARRERPQRLDQRAIERSAPSSSSAYASRAAAPAETSADLAARSRACAAAAGRASGSAGRRQSAARSPARARRRQGRCAAAAARRRSTIAPPASAWRSDRPSPIATPARGRTAGRWRSSRRARTAARCASMATSGIGSRFGGSAALIAPHGPRPRATTPIAPPTIDSIRLSASSWRSSRLRLAPIAVRMAISFCRAAARASSRLAMLAHAISSTKPTAPSSTSSAVCSWRADERVVEGDQPDAPVLHLGILLARARGDRVHLRLRLLERDAGAAGARRR